MKDTCDDATCLTPVPGATISQETLDMNGFFDAGSKRDPTYWIAVLTLIAIFSASNSYLIYSY